MFWLGPTYQDPARPECSFAEIYELKDMSRHRPYRADLPLATTPPCKEGDQKSHDFWLRYGKNEWRILEIWNGGVIVMNACGDEEILGAAPPPVAKPEVGVGVEESNFGPGRVQTFDNCERVVFTPDLRGEELEWVLETWKRPGIPEMKVFVATKGQKIPYSPTDLSAMLRVYLYGEKCGEPLPPPEPEPSPIEVE